MIHLSRPVRLAVREGFASQFNAQLALACASLSLQPFEIDFSQPGNYWDADVSMEMLCHYLQENPKGIPALCLFGKSLRASGRPGAVDGRVAIAGRVFVRYGLDEVDFETLREVVEAAITGILLESQTDDWGGGTYENNLDVVSSGLVYQTGSIYREIYFDMSFQVTAR